MTSCMGCTTVDADEETVLIDKPWFLGHGGVQSEPVETGLEWIWWSTDTETFKIVPFKHQVDMDDLFSAVAEDTDMTAAEVEAQYEAILEQYAGDAALAAADFIERVAEWRQAAHSANP